MASPALSARSRRDVHEKCEMSIQNLKAMVVLQEEKMTKLSQERDDAKIKLFKIKHDKLQFIDGDDEIWEELDIIMDRLRELEDSNEMNLNASKYRNQVLELQKTLMAVNSQKAGYEETCIRLETELKQSKMQTPPKKNSDSMAVFNLETKVENLENEVSTLRINLEIQRHESEKWRFQYLEKERALVDLEYKSEDLSNDLNNKSAQLEQLKAFLKKKNEEIESLTKSNNELFDRNVTLEEERNHSEKVLKEYSTIKAKSSRRESELKEALIVSETYSEKIKVLEERLGSESNRIKSLESRIGELSQDNTKKELRIASISHENESLKKKLENARDQILVIESENERHINSLSNSIPIAAEFAQMTRVQLLETSINLHTDLERMEEKAKELESIIEKNENDMRELKTSLENQEPIIANNEAELRELHSTIEKQSSQLSSLEKTLKERKSQLSSIESILKEKESQLSSTETILKEKNHQILDLEAIIKEQDSAYEEFNSILKSKDQEIMTLNSSIKEKDSSFEKYKKEKEETISKLKNSMDKEIEVQRRRFSSLFEEKEAEIHTLKSKINEAPLISFQKYPINPSPVREEDYKSLKKKNTEVLDELSKVKGEKEFINQLLQEYIKEKNALISTIESLEKENKQLNETKSNRDSKLTDIREECRVLQEELSKLSELAYVAEDLKAALEREEELKEKVFTLEQEIKELNSDNSNVASTLETLESQLKEKEEKMTESSLAHAHLMHENSVLKEKLEECIIKISSLSQHKESEGLKFRELELAQETIASLEKSNEAAQTNLKHWQNKSLFLSSEIERLTSLLISKDNEISNLVSDLSLIQEDREILERVIDENKRELRVLASQLDHVPGTPKDNFLSNGNGENGVFQAYKLQTRWRGYDEGKK